MKNQGSENTFSFIELKSVHSLIAVFGDLIDVTLVDEDKQNWSLLLLILMKGTA